MQSEPGRLARPLSPQVAVTGIGLALLAGVLVRTAWVCDDAYITFRVLDNAVNGFGLRWNPFERVQVATHPLWMLVLLPLYALTRDAYVMPMLAAGACTLGAMAGLGGRLAAGQGMAVVAFAGSLASMAFVDFSTSGLENALAHLLLVGFVVIWRSDPSERRLTGMAVVAGLVALNRLDHAVLVSPALLAPVLNCSPRVALRSLALGGTPLLAWLLFALVYYGYPLPNTALAKLGAGIPAADLRLQGLGYLLNSFRWDPVTLTVIASGFLAGSLRPGVDRALALGMACNLCWVVSVGGDHMSGRFLSAPFVVGLILLVRIPMSGLGAGILAPTLLAFGLVTRTPPLLSDASMLARDLDGWAIADERGYYYFVSGLLRRRIEGPWEASYRMKDAREAREAGKVIVFESMIGWYGYGVGPTVHVIDSLGLSDPLLARLPMRAGTWRVGHYVRALPPGHPGDPDGYPEALRPLVRDVALLTRAPLISWDRAAAVSRGLSGEHRFIAQRYCSLACDVFEPMALRFGRAADDPFRVPPSGIAVRVADSRHRRALLTLEPGLWRLELREGEKTVGAVPLTVSGPGRLARVEVLLDKEEFSDDVSSVRLFAEPEGRSAWVRDFELVP